MKCPFENCDMDTECHHDPLAHLLVTIAPNGHPHVHGTVGQGDERWTEIMIIAIARVAAIDLHKVASEIEAIESQELANKQTIQ